ncbi:MAG: amidohydrolase, partial [Xanthomonadales bacterium]|nr:amidohydrolase [Xanthomonadales bacterium]
MTRLLFLLASLLFVSPLHAAEGDAESSEDEPKWDVQNPPGPWRSVRIDTERTTWSNLDVSPDGKTIVFDMLGDIYSMSIDGGEAAALTSGIAWNMQPRFSPDGKRIAFISDRNGADNLWLMNADGSEPEALTEERDHLIHNPNWSPDGNWLVVRKGFVSTRSIPSGEIWMFHVGGGKGLQLVELPHGEQSQKNIAEPAFSTDGRYVYYSQDVTPGSVWQYNKNALEQVFVIKRLDREEGKTIQFAGGPGGAIRPTPSPDGKHLAFVRRMPDMHSALVVKSLQSGNERTIFKALERDLQETSGSQGNTPAFAWTPDSNSLVFWAGGMFHRTELESGETTPIPVHVSDERQVRETLRYPVTVWDETFPVKALRWAQYSPAGDKVVFQALGYLYVKDLESGEQERLTRQSDHFEFWPAWSPDGRHIVYTTWDDQDLGTVRVVPARGGRSSVVSDQPGHYIQPRFSPDGEEIVFRKFEGGSLLSPKWTNEPGIYIVSADGGKQQRVVDSGSNPAFNTDASRILYSAPGENGILELKSVDRDGDDERTHFKGPKITEYSVSPDGRWVAFTEQYNAYVAPFAATGKTVDLSRKTEAFPVRQVSKRSGENLHWSSNADSLRWSHGATLYSRDLSDAFAFLDGAPAPLPEPATQGVDLGFTHQSDAPEGIIALVNGRIITMRDADGFEEVIQDGTIIVSGNRIQAVGQSVDIEIPDGAFVLDLDGKTVIPG